jgi:purine-binding chemotaxis protein CheW
MPEKGSRGTDAVTGGEDQQELVIFQVEDELFGIDIYRVSEITPMMEITKVPRSLPFVEGIINLRGKIIPILDLRRRLGFPSSTRDVSNRIIIVRMERHRMGLLVDRVNKVSRLTAETVEAIPPGTLQIDADFIAGVGHLEGRLIILLKLERLLTPQEKQMLASGVPPTPERTEKP